MAGLTLLIVRNFLCHRSRFVVSQNTAWSLICLEVSGLTTTGAPVRVDRN